MPLFTVVIPTYNRAHLIGRAMKSVLCQSVDDFEIVVVDDGSEDDTQKVVETFCDERIKYVAQEKSGAGVARNYGAQVGKGTFLTFLDSDDEALPDWLEKFAEGFQKASADIVCCGSVKVQEKNGMMEAHVSLPRDMGSLFGHRTGMFQGGMFALRKDIFDQIGGYASNLSSGQHTEFAMRLIPMVEEKGWLIYNVMHPLIRVHIHKGTRIRGNPEAIYKGSAYVLQRHDALLRQVPRIKAVYHSIAGVNAYRLGKHQEAIGHFGRSAWTYPCHINHWFRLLLSLVPPLAHLKWPRISLRDGIHGAARMEVSSEQTILIDSESDVRNA